jgi:hypothetical protein
MYSMNSTMNKLSAFAADVKKRSFVNIAKTRDRVGARTRNEIIYATDRFRGVAIAG